MNDNELENLDNQEEQSNERPGMADIRARQNEEQGLVDDYVDEDEVAPTEEYNDDTPEGLAEEVAPVVEAEVIAPTRHKLKVNGKELDVSYEELLARAQKVEAADDYLRRAKEIADAQQNYQSEPSPEDVQADDEELELVRAIQMGSEQEATAAIRKLMNNAKTAIDKEELFREIEQRDVGKRAAQQAYEKFKTDFADIASNPYLSKMAADEDLRLQAQGDARPLEQRFTEVGNTIRSIRDSMVATTHKVDEKLLKKINAPTVPKSAGRQATHVEEQEEQEETSAQRFARIAKSRSATK